MFNDPEIQSQLKEFWERLTEKIIKEPDIRDYYKFHFYAEIRKYRNIAQPVFRFFNFRREKEISRYGGIDFPPIFKDFYRLIYSYSLGASPNLEDQTAIRRFVYRYNFFLKHMHYYRQNTQELKAIKVHASIQNFHSYKFTQKNYYFYINEQFVEIWPRRHSCAIHGLDPRDEGWQKICYHYFCNRCKFYADATELYPLGDDREQKSSHPYAIKVDISLKNGNPCYCWYSGDFYQRNMNFGNIRRRSCPKFEIINGEEIRLPF